MFSYFISPNKRLMTSSLFYLGESLRLLSPHWLSYSLHPVTASHGRQSRSSSSCDCRVCIFYYRKARLMMAAAGKSACHLVCHRVERERATGTETDRRRGGGARRACQLGFDYSFSHHSPVPFHRRGRYKLCVKEYKIWKPCCWFDRCLATVKKRVNKRHLLFFDSLLLLLIRVGIRKKMRKWKSDVVASVQSKLRYERNVRN